MSATASSMKHLLVSREYPPSTYPRGGIGTYVEHIARLLAGRGEIVHVVAELWDRAPRPREELYDGRLVVHRVPLGHPAPPTRGEDRARMQHVLDAMAGSAFPAQSFSWQAALLAERLIESEGIDVIEGQDYEAPLYYMLVRRSLGIGPAARPPCIVHLHSPWELVCSANDWGLASAYDVTIKRLEDYAIRAADAVLCPSRFLAEQAERHYALPAGSVDRIPYPIGHTPFVERPPETWARGTICYFGRLEPRKGVLEWLRAAVDAAARRPGLRFELIGADTSLTGSRDSSMRRVLESRVPAHLASSFTFVDALPRRALLERLAHARLAVVPSRWENFPHTCVEAMCSGLPVLASPHGGMAEMVEDGRTGWVAGSGRSCDLAASLARALDTPPEALAVMGRTASESIRRLCDNDVTLDRHLALRRRLMARGARQSLMVPVMPTWLPPGADSAGRSAVARKGPGTPDRSAAGTGLAVVVVDAGASREDLLACLSSIAAQSVAPASVVVVTTDVDAAEAAGGGRPGWRVLRGSSLSVETARHAGVRSAIDTPAAPAGVAILDGGCRLEPSFVAAAVTVLERQPNVGVISSWSWEGTAAKITIDPHPALPYAWTADEIAPGLVIRAEALHAMPWVADIAGGMPEPRALVAAILAEGWQGATYPAVLSGRQQPVPADVEALARGVRERLQLATLERYRDRLAQDAPFLAHVAQTAIGARAHDAGAPRQIGRGALSPATVWRLSPAEQMALVGRAARNPAYAATWLIRHLLKRVRG